MPLTNLSWFLIILHRLKGCIMQEILYKIKDLLGSLVKTPSKHQIFHQHLCRAFKLGEIIHTKDIDLDEALTYVENKAEDLIHIDKMISFSLSLKDTKMYVLLAPTPNGGIYISVYDRDIKKKNDHILCV